MTIQNQTNRTGIAGNGVTTVVGIPFPFQSPLDLKVLQLVIATGIQTPLTFGTDYSVTGATNNLGHYPQGGSVVLAVAPAIGIHIVIYRDPDATQLTDPVENGPLPVDAAVEAPLDKLTMLVIRLKERFSRTVRQPDGDLLDMAALPPIVTRANKFLGFDGDGNPVIPTQPDTIAVPIAQLTGSTVSNLPAAGNAGLLRRVTDQTRGVWMDTGTQWISLQGDVLNAREFLKGDGTDEAAAFQLLLNTEKDIFFPRPPVAYAVGSGLTLSASNQRLFGIGRASIIRALNSGFNLFTPSTSISNFEMDHLQFQGAADDDTTGQYVFFTNVGSPITDSTFHHLYISGATPDVGFNAGLKFEEASNRNNIHSNRFDRLIGAISGIGYAVQVGEATHNHIHDNLFLGSPGNGRHAVYLGSGASWNAVYGNTILDYNGAGVLMYAFDAQEASSYNVVYGNVIQGGGIGNSEEGGIDVTGKSHHNHIEGNIIRGFDPQGICVSDAGEGGECIDNSVVANKVLECQEAGIFISGAKKTLVSGNDVFDNSQESAGSHNGIDIRSSGSYGTELCEDTTVIGNRSHGATQRYAFSINPDLPYPTGTVIRGNDFRPGVSGAMEANGVLISGDDVCRITAESQASVPVDALGFLKTFFSLTVNNGSNFAIQAPTSAVNGKELVITIRNMSGGAAGTLTFASTYKTTGAWTQPSSGRSRSITFVYDGADWIEHFRSAADILT